MTEQERAILRKTEEQLLRKLRDGETIQKICQDRVIMLQAKADRLAAIAPDSPAVSLLLQEAEDAGFPIRASCERLTLLRESIADIQERLAEGA